MEYCFFIADHYVHVDYMNDDDMLVLLPSFVPFIHPVSVLDGSGDGIAGGQGVNRLLARVSVGDGLHIDDVAGEVGQFDCGGAMFGVYCTASGGYIIHVNDIRGRLCGILQASPLFDEARVVLKGVTRSERTYALNNALMLVYAFAAADKQTLMMHSSVVRNGNRGYMFLGVSGTGKSTHTRLWRENIPGSDLLNDDNPVVRVVDGVPYVYGTPWSGKTPCYRQLRVPVGGITQLEQKPYNRIEACGTLQALASMLVSVSNMKWDSRVHNGILTTISQVLGVVGMCVMGCRPDADAARVSYDYLSRNVKTVKCDG